jgi:hypothetical protein
MPKIDYSAFAYRNDDGKGVYGTAAHQNFIKEIGGLQKYHDFIGTKYIESFVKENSDSINSEVSADARRKRFKKIV